MPALKFVELLCAVTSHGCEGPRDLPQDTGVGGAVMTGYRAGAKTGPMLLLRSIVIFKSIRH